MKSPTEIISPQEIVLRNDVSDVVHLNEFVTQVCDAIHCDTAAQFSIQLALEEAVVNAMNYAYAAGTEGEIRVKAEGDASAIKFEIRDRGIPFDPTLADDPDITLPAEERKEGGLGIFLIRNYMDEVRYERVGQENILTLTKKL